MVCLVLFEPKRTYNPGARGHQVGAVPRQVPYLFKEHQRREQVVADKPHIPEFVLAGMLHRYTIAWERHPTQCPLMEEESLDVQPLCRQVIV